MATSDIISSLGAGSGIDIKSIVSQLTEVEKSPRQDRIDSKRTSIETTLSAYGLMQSALSEFQSILEPLGDADTFNARAVSFPDTDVVTPTELAANAQVGTYQLEVLQVAQSQSLASAGVADPDAALGAGELTISFGAWDSYTEVGGPVGFTVNDDKDAFTVEISEDDTLRDIADKINDSDSGVQASVILNDGSYQLLLTAESGEQNALQLSLSAGSDAALDFLAFEEGNASMTQNQEGVDALVKVNGLEVSRSSNEVDDVIPGLTFSLNKADEGNKLTFSITQDTDTGQQAIEDFVEAYNTLMETLTNLTKYSTEDDEEDETFAGGLQHEGTAKTIINRLRSMVTSSVGGVEGFAALTNIGIRTQLDGTLEIIDEEFDAAIENNFDDVAKLFSPNVSSSSSTVSASMGSAIDKTVAGSYDVVISQAPAKGSIESDVVSSLDTSAGGYTFDITVNGVTSNTITLTDTVYADGDELASELQRLINADTNLDEAGVGLDVSYDSDTGTLLFESRSYGDTSKVSFSNASASMSDIGISDALTGTTGRNVSGTVGGVSGFGVGNVLLPDLDSDAYGLRLTVSPTASGTSTVNFSRGLGGELNLLIDSLLGSNGGITTRETSLNDQLDGLDDDQDKLDRRMDAYEARLLNQFSLMESIISSLQSSSGQLEGLVDRLPFTASNN